MRIRRPIAVIAGKGLKKHKRTPSGSRRACWSFSTATDSHAATQFKHGTWFEIALWAIKAGVRVRSVQDDRTFQDLATAANQGERNTEDSRRKSESTKDGLRRAVERGEWRGGTVSEGYEVVREVDEHGRKVCTIVKHPEDAEIFELLWGLAREDKSQLAISLELSRRGYRTRPLRKDRQSKPFDVRRVSQTLDNAFYAGLQSWQGNTYPGNWPTYVDVETFWRLKAERAKHAKRSRGRPPEGYLLSGLARCGLCGGSAHAVTGRKPRKDGTRPRHYVCYAHRANHKDSEEWCSATPWDAAVVDRMVLGGLDYLLGDAESLREQMLSGQRAERDKLARVAGDARMEAGTAERDAERAEADYAAALSQDDLAREVAMNAAKRKRAEAARAESRMNAALDALTDADRESEGDPDQAMAQLWEALSGALGSAQGDVKVMNAALREHFARFELHAGLRV